MSKSPDTAAACRGIPPGGILELASGQDDGSQAGVPGEQSWIGGGLLRWRGDGRGWWRPARAWLGLLAQSVGLLSALWLIAALFLAAFAAAGSLRPRPAAREPADAPRPGA